MKLKAFIANNVYGYINFHIEFYSDLSFLIGVNGSGKTTVLRLIQALLTPSVRELIVIPFSKISVIYEDKEDAIEISCNKSDQIRLAVSIIENALSLPAVDSDELDYLLAREGPQGDFLEEYQLKYADHEVFQFISKISAPVFLGLERTYKSSSEFPSDAFYERERLLVGSGRRGLRGKRIVQGSLAAGLMETQVLVQEAYRRLRREEEKHSEHLKESMLLSAFRYHEYTSPEGGESPAPPAWMEQREMLARKAELEGALKNIGLSGERVTKELEDFFDRLNNLFSSIDYRSETKGYPIEWLINKAQINRVSTLIRIIDEYKSQTDKLYSPIKTFLSSVNTFYQDTQKSLEIDAVGQLCVLRPDKKSVPVEALSSGERQLLIIFAHLLFNGFVSRGNIFIIDEPELSLHLRWQERFVSKAVEVSPDTQLILATHSPEILGGYEKHSIAV